MDVRCWDTSCQKGVGLSIRDGALNTQYATLLLEGKWTKEKAGLKRSTSTHNKYIKKCHLIINSYNKKNNNNVFVLLQKSVRKRHFIHTGENKSVNIKR